MIFPLLPDDAYFGIFRLRSTLAFVTNPTFSLPEPTSIVHKDVKNPSPPIHFINGKGIYDLLQPVYQKLWKLCIVLCNKKSFPAGIACQTIYPPTSALYLISCSFANSIPGFLFFIFSRLHGFLNRSTDKICGGRGGRTGPPVPIQLPDRFIISLFNFFGLIWSGFFFCLFFHSPWLEMAIECKHPMIVIDR